MRRRNLLSSQRTIPKPSLYFSFNTSEPREIISNQLLNVNNTALVTYSAGKLGIAPYFTANLSGFRRIGWSPDGAKFWDANGDLPFSFSCWVYKTASNGAGNNVLFGNFTSGGAGSTAYGIYVLSQTDEVLIYKNDAINGQRRIQSLSQLARNTWNLIIYTDAGIGNEKLYINNVEEAVAITDMGYVSMKNSNPSGIGIGSVAISNTSGSTMIGGIDDIGAWRNLILTEKDRARIWNSGVGRKLL